MPNNSKSLCWDCAKWCNGCPWSKCSAPVIGWVADYKIYNRGVMRNKKGYTYLIESYNVKSCPLFENDNGDYHVTKMNEDDCIELLKAVVLRCFDDYLIWQKWCNKHNVLMDIERAELLDYTERFNSAYKKMVLDLHKNYVEALVYIRNDPYGALNGVEFDKIIDHINTTYKGGNDDRKSRKSKVLSE